jgi:hypothetical protein
MKLDFENQNQPVSNDLELLELPSSYYVAPLQTSEKGFQLCLYFSAPDWVLIDPPILKYYYNQTNGGFLRISRPSNDRIRPHLPIGMTLDEDRDLFAAVAQTRHGEELLPNVFRAHNRQIIVPALFTQGNDGSRALVLVFSKPTSDGFELRSTSDPIITPDPRPVPSAPVRRTEEESTP